MSSFTYIFIPPHSASDLWLTSAQTPYCLANKSHDLSGQYSSRNETDSQSRVLRAVGREDNARGLFNINRARNWPSSFALISSNGFDPTSHDF